MLVIVLQTQQVQQKLKFNFQIGGFMKKLLALFILLITLITSTFIISCGDDTEEPKTVTITFNSNGGSIVESQVFVVGVNYQLEIPTKEGYEFIGWYLDAEFKVLVNSNDFTSDKDATLYAKWGEQGVYFYINYDLREDETIVETEYPTKVLCGEGTIKLPTVYKKGYTFLGWKESGKNEVITMLTTNRTSQVTLIPYFKKA